jgi:hypothetical protein
VGILSVSIRIASYTGCGIHEKRNRLPELPGPNGDGSRPRRSEEVVKNGQLLIGSKQPNALAKTNLFFHLFPECRQQSLNRAAIPFDDRRKLIALGNDQADAFYIDVDDL